MSSEYNNDHGSSKADSIQADFKHYGMKELKIFIGDIYKALRDKNMAFDQLFDDYERYHESVNTGGGNLERAKVIEDWIEPHSTLLDAGIGDGTISEYLMKKKALEVLGFDVSKIACEKAAKLGIRARVRDINSGLSLDEGEFYDYILLAEVIEHTVYPQKILTEAVKHCKKGVIVTIPNSAYIRWRIQLLRGFAPRQSFTHLHYWSIKDFELFCKVLHIKTVAFKTFLPKQLLRFRNLLAFQQCWLLEPETQRFEDNQSIK